MLVQSLKERKMDYKKYFGITKRICLKTSGSYRDTKKYHSCQNSPLFKLKAMYYIRNISPTCIREIMNTSCLFKECVKMFVKYEY